MSGRQFLPPQTLFGLLLLVIGVLLFLQNIGWLDGEVWRFWPLLIVGVGTLKLLTAVHTIDRLIGVGLITFGVLRIATARLGLDVGPLDILSALLVVFGSAIAWRGLRGGPTSVGFSRSTADDYVSALAFMGGYGPKCTSSSFTGADVTVFMGGIELDLRGADLRQTAVIDAFVMWGGVEIKVPNDWTVELRGTPILAGLEDKTAAPPVPGVKRLVVRGAVIMGGIEVKN